MLLLPDSLAACCYCLQIADAVGQLCDTLSFGGPSVVECRKVATLPTVQVVIGGTSFPLTPQQYVLKIESQVGGWTGGP